MAITVITPVKLTARHVISAAVAASAIDATNGASYVHSDEDSKILLIITSSVTGTVVVKAGNGWNGVADLSVAVVVGTQYLTIDSGRYKNTFGTNKGKVLFTGPATSSLAVIFLP